MPELLKKHDANVISIDYGTLVTSPWYNVAVENVYRVRIKDIIIDHPTY